MTTLTSKAFLSEIFAVCEELLWVTLLDTRLRLPLKKQYQVYAYSNL